MKNKALEILLDELNEQGHPERVEDVIFWALDYYAKNRPKEIWGTIIASYIVDRIEFEEINQLNNETK